MALPRSALPELLDAVRAGDGPDVWSEAIALVLHDLIELGSRWSHRPQFSTLCQVILMRHPVRACTW